MSSPDPTEGLIRELLAQGHSPVDIAAHLVDRDVANGEYEGCSSELEMAHDEYRRQAESLSEPVFACTATAINAYWGEPEDVPVPQFPQCDACGKHYAHSTCARRSRPSWRVGSWSATMPSGSATSAP